MSKEKRAILLSLDQGYQNLGQNDENPFISQKLGPLLIYQQRKPLLHSLIDPQTNSGGVQGEQRDDQPLHSPIDLQTNSGGVRGEQYADQIKYLSNDRPLHSLIDPQTSSEKLWTNSGGVQGV